MASQRKQQNRRRALGIKDVKHLCFLLHVSRDLLNDLYEKSESYYRLREENVRGKVRCLAVPQGPLMRLLKKLNAELQTLNFPSYMQGGLKKRSNITNALHHTNKPTVLCADIKDFFPSIDATRVTDMFRNRLGCSREVADVLGRLCTCRAGLPQGAPTSMVIANLVIEHLAFRLKRFAETHSATYTQYVDDIAISGPRHLERLKPLVAQIIEEEGFVCHPDKLKVIHSDEEQVVTGVRVNDGPDVPRAKLEEVRFRLSGLAGDGSLCAEADSKTISSVAGQIEYVRRLNRGAGRHLRRKLAPGPYS